MSCMLCDPLSGLERVRYFPRQLITADDMTLEQSYLRQKLRRHNRFLHGWGVVCGLAVEAAPTAEEPWRGRGCPGYALGPPGDENMVGGMVHVDLTTGRSEPEPCSEPWPCPPRPAPGRRRARAIVYLAFRYAECHSRPVRVHPAGCGCDDLACEYSRTRDDFELRVLSALPRSHEEALKLDQAWCDRLKEWSHKRELPLPAPPCFPCPEEPWVVLARIRLPADSAMIADGDISNDGRRMLYSTMALQQMFLGLGLGP